MLHTNAKLGLLGYQLKIIRIIFFSTDAESSPGVTVSNLETAQMSSIYGGQQVYFDTSPGVRRVYSTEFIVYFPSAAYNMCKQQLLSRGTFFVCVRNYYISCTFRF